VKQSTSVWPDRNILCYTFDHYSQSGEARIAIDGRRTAWWLVGAVVLALGVLVSAACSAPLVPRAVPQATPTRTPRPTWTPAGQGLLVATPTLDVTPYPAAVRSPTPQPPTPQVLVAGSAQGIVVPAGQGGVQTVVVILVTATPTNTSTPLPPGPTNTPGPTPTPGPPTPTPLPPAVVHIKTDQANVRQGPGETYPLITRLDTGTTVTIVGRNRTGDWWKICCINGSDVWISDAVVNVDGPIWTVSEATNIPPAPPVPPTPANTSTPAPTPTYAWTFRPESVKEYPLGQQLFRVDGALYNGSTPLWGYRLKIRNLETGQEWLSDRSEAYWKGETVEWMPEPTPNVEVKRNVKWDSSGLAVPLTAGAWEVTATDGAGNPLSAPVRLVYNPDKSKWYYIVFTTR
jgi:uncharacterized protein YgiM (DUF1202 family)